MRFRDVIAANAGNACAFAPSRLPVLTWMADFDLSPTVRRDPTGAMAYSERVVLDADEMRGAGWEQGNAPH